MHGEKIFVGRVTLRAAYVAFQLKTGRYVVLNTQLGLSAYAITAHLSVVSDVGENISIHQVV